MTNKSTDTPRTDAQSWTEYDHAGNMHETPSAVSRYFARELERELAEAKADVKRLRANLRRAVDIADVLRSGGSRACRELHHSKRDQHEYGEVCPVEERLEKAESELDQIKATLNPKSK